MAINHIKEEAWRGVLEDFYNTSDDRKLWRMIKLLNGTPENNSSHKAMMHNDRFNTSDKKKADIFIKHYAGVSKIDMAMKDRIENRNFKISLSELRGQNSSYELRDALKICGQNGLPCPKTSPFHFLKFSIPMQSNFSFTYSISPLRLEISLKSDTTQT